MSDHYDLNSFVTPHMMFARDKVRTPLSPVSYAPSRSSADFRIPMGQPVSLLPGESVPLVTTSGLWKSVHYDINGTDRGQLYSYNALIGPQPQAKALVVCCHGQLNGAPLSDAYKTVWDDLAKFLARDGFAVASIRHNSTGAESARLQFLTHVSHLLGPNSPAAMLNVWGKPLVLMGASEGATGAIMAAESISKFVISNVVSYVDAVIALAPTKIFTEKYTDHLLVMQGTHDGDAEPGAGSVTSYEFAKPFISKHFIWIHGANHCRMLNSTGIDATVESLQSDIPTLTNYQTQHLIVRNYVTAFLRWKITNEAAFRAPFIGDGSFAFETSSDPAVQDDVSKGRLGAYPLCQVYGSTAKLCESEEIVFSNMLQNGKLITAQNPAKLLSLVNHTTDDLLKPQLQPGFLVAWNRNQYPGPSISVPLNVDMKGIKYVEFEVAWADRANNPKGGLILPIRLRLQMNNAFSYSNYVYVRVPPLKVMTGQPSERKVWTRAILSTVRIPVTAWNNASAAVQMVCNFHLSNAPIGRLAIARLFARYS